MSQHFERLTGEYRVKVVAKASLVLGTDPNGERVSFTLDGFARIREWPSVGYERRTLKDGRVQVDLEMVESLLEGTVPGLNAPISITETPENRNFGTLTQINPGEDFPAEFNLYRVIFIDTPLGRLHNKEPIHMQGTFDHIPPLAQTEGFDGPNIPQAINTPVPLFNDKDEVIGYFSDRLTWVTTAAPA